MATNISGTLGVDKIDPTSITPLIASTAEAQAGTDNTKLMTALRVAESSLGRGQTWQDVTASRAAGTNYTNTTGKPIFISVSGGGQPNHGQMSMTVGGVFLGIQGFRSIASGRSDATMNAIVPNNTTYRVDNVLGWSLINWTELR